jgi:hypothetical protein
MADLARAFGARLAPMIGVAGRTYRVCFPPNDLSPASTGMGAIRTFELNLVELAAAERITPSYLARVLRLTLFAPEPWRASLGATEHGE